WALAGDEAEKLGWSSGSVSCTAAQNLPDHIKFSGFSHRTAKWSCSLKSSARAASASLWIICICALLILATLLMFAAIARICRHSEPVSAEMNAVPTPLRTPEPNSGQAETVSNLREASSECSYYTVVPAKGAPTAADGYREMVADGD
uniref:Neural_ProG_Cyt domain-containing protein n=1 Tax=Macrostomum lignano TaxID=282301 RepID=A0A1I8H6K6_9PLAT